MEVFKDQPEVADDEPEVELINWNGYKFEKILTKEEPENSQTKQKKQKPI